MAVSMRDVGIWAAIIGTVVVGGTVAEGERRSHEALDRYFDDLAAVTFGNEQVTNTRSPSQEQPYKLIIAQP